MPRFSAVFPRRKSTAPDELLNAEPAGPEQHSFRVLERNTFAADGRSFDGGVRLSQRIGNPTYHKPRNSELDVEDNLFAGLNINRASGASNTTKATSTDASSRHSNASTAPSSADMAHTHEDSRTMARKQVPEPASRQSSKSNGNSIFDRAGRTFSFGQRKHNATAPKQESVPEVPPLPTLQRQDEHGRTRGMTVSTTSTETAPTLHESSDLDLGGDFGSMFTSFDKRSSTATLRNDLSGGAAQRAAQPAPLSLDKSSSVETPPMSAESGRSDDDLLGPTPAFASRNRLQPQAPRHQASFEYRSSVGPGGVVDDDDAKLLSDSVAAGKYLNMDEPSGNGRGNRFQSDEDTFTALPRKPFAHPVSSHFEREDNMFAGSVSRVPRATYRPAASSKANSEGENKVMTPAQFERYRLDKEREDMAKAANPSAKSDDEDDDDINYDDDEEDEDEKMKRQAKQRREQQTQMAAYRQKMMKTTGQPARTPSPTSLSRPTFSASLSAPHLGIAKTPSPELARPADDDDEDEDVPLAILQAHGFPHKSRAPSRLTVVGSNPNLRATAQAQPQRPGSAMGEPTKTSAQRSSTLPAFARGLPQDPFVGASIARPAIRESLSFAGGVPAGSGPVQQPQAAPMHPGGLVGVIASEERSRAMRRGSPNLPENARGLVSGIPGGMQQVDPLAQLNPQVMYGQGMQGGFPQMSQQQQSLSVGDQAQIQMNQQMAQFMQMQMQFMQMMAANQNGGGSPMQQMPQMPGMPGMPGMQQQGPMVPPHQHPYSGYAASQSVGDFSSGQSVVGNMVAPPRRLDAGMRTMSMIQPNTSSPMLNNGFGHQAQGPGSVYTPSIAPSERSNVGLPGRYRPVSQASAAFAPGLHQRSATMSGAFDSPPLDLKPKSHVRATSKLKSSSDEDDDDEGWESMKAKRDAKKSRWRFKKDAEFHF